MSIATCVIGSRAALPAESGIRFFFHLKVKRFKHPTVFRRRQRFCPITLLNFSLPNSFTTVSTRIFLPVSQRPALRWPLAYGPRITRIMRKGASRLFHTKTRGREAWRASVPTSRLPLCGRMVSDFIAERREGQVSACPTAVTPPPNKTYASPRLCVKKRSMFKKAGGDARLQSAQTQNTRSTRMTPCHQPITAVDIIHLK
jgi:hypothetical protein